MSGTSEQCPPFPRSVAARRSSADRQGRKEAESEEVEGRWRELWTWLGTALDDFGLDAPLYARCLLSILRQPPSALQDSDSESEGEEDGLSAAPSRLRRAPSADSAAAEDARAVALIECLSTAELPGRELTGLVDQLLRRYRDLEKATSRQADAAPNESIDSGVCPSPETADSFQNYDEAFPPLLELGGTEFLGKPPPLPIPRPAEETPVAEELPLLPEPVPVPTAKKPPPTDPIVVGWASGWRRKSPGSLVGSLPSRGHRLSEGLPFTTQWTRPNSELRRTAFDGSGQMEWYSTGRSHQYSELYGSGLKEVGGLTQLTSKPQTCLFSATPPTFVVPKFRGSAHTSVKVGSCPSKLEFGYSGPPGAQCDLWNWLSAQTASVHPHNQAGQPPPPSPGLPDLDSSIDFPSLRTINEDPQPQLPPPLPVGGGHRQHWQGAEEGRQVYPSLAEEAPLEPWEAMDSSQLDAGNYSFNFDPSTDCYLEPPSMEEEPIEPSSASPPGFVVPRLANMAGADSVRPSGRHRHQSAAGFKGIRSESMEFAFTPSHRHPSPGSYAVDYVCGQEWYVLRDPSHPPNSSRLASRPRTRQSSVCTEASEPKRRRPSGKSDTLPLKFQAAKPAKMVQTEPEGIEPPLLLHDDLCNNNSLPAPLYDRGEHWDRWRDEGREWEENVQDSVIHGSAPLFMPPNNGFADSEGHKIVSLGAGSSIWESVPRTCVWEWGGEGGEADAPARSHLDTASEAADDDFLLNLVGSISVTAPL